MGYHDSVRHIDEGMRSGRIEAAADGLKVRVSGDTYPVKDFLKGEYGARWDRGAKAWTIDCAQ